jgi:NitT/TauT family transport system substrate-binding protein/sulfonate transport system substrate-binding protein
MSHLPSFTSRRRVLQALGALPLGVPAWLRAAEPARLLRIGYQKFNTINILKGTGRLEQALALLGIEVKWAEFAAGPQLLEALNAGAIDFGHAADAPSVFAQSSGSRAVYLAAEQPYPRGIGVLVKQDGPLQSLRDLKGRKVAIGRGWNVQYLLVRALEEAGLSYDDIVPAYVTNAADARAAFESGRVDAVGLWDPFLAGAEINSPTRVLRNGDGLSNNRTFYLSTPDFLQANSAVLRRFFAELKKTDAWANGHPQEVADLLAPQLGIPAPVLKRATERRHYGAVPVDAGIVAEQQRMADTFARLKLIPQSIRVQEAVYQESVLA